MDKITLKEHAKLHQGFMGLAFITVGILVVIILVLYFRTLSLQDTIQEKVYIAVDGKYYLARPEQKKLKDRMDYIIFAETWAYNMFSHDINSLDERLSYAKPWMYETGYEYILSNYATGENAGWEDGLKNLKTLYKTRDARTYYEIDSVRVNMDLKNKVVRLYGKQKAVFAVGNDVIVPMDLEIEVHDGDKSDLNPFGLTIKKFNYIR